jgi:hypothetical protein
MTKVSRLEAIEAFQQKIPIEKSKQAYSINPNCRLASKRPIETLTDRFKLLTSGRVIGIYTLASQAFNKSAGMPSVSLPNSNQSPS